MNSPNPAVWRKFSMSESTPPSSSKDFIRYVLSLWWIGALSGVERALDDRWKQALICFAVAAFVASIDYWFFIKKEGASKVARISAGVVIGLVVISIIVIKVYQYEAFSRLPPLKIVYLQSDTRLDLENITDTDIYVDTLVIVMDVPVWSHSIAVDAVVPAHKTLPVQIAAVEPIANVATNNPSLKWPDHVAGAMAKFKNCFRLVIFQKGASTLQMLEQYNAKIGSSLLTQDLQGTLNYHYLGEQTAKTETVELTAMIAAALPPACVPN